MSPHSLFNISSKIKIGTRSSLLAMTQAHYIRDSLKNISGLSDNDFQIIPLKTTGDTLTNTKLQDFGGKGLFTKEIEQALIDKKIDLAVHSGKDVPTQRQDGLCILAIPPREDCRDVFISYKYPTLNDLPSKAIIGTASLRRTAQLLHKRPDLEIVLLRGNVQTRLNKLSNGICDATMLAYAGLKRLDMSNIATQILDYKTFLPAPAQGALMIETRTDINNSLESMIKQLNCSDTADCVMAERSLLKTLDGNCRTPIAAYATINNQELHLQGELLSEDGQIRINQSLKGLRKNYEAIGLELGNIIKKAFFK